MVKLSKHKLGDLIEVTRGASLSGAYFATQGKYIRLTCGNFDYQNNCFKENQSKDNIYYVGDFKPEFLLNEGDIITPLTEQAIGLLGSTAIIPKSGKYIQSQDVAKVVCKEGKIDRNYAFYLISSDMVKKQLSAAAQQTKIRHTSPDKIKDCVVWVPEYDEQVKIGKVLTALDRKIALNRAINHNLEAMAKQLYDYWFVQFDFPNAEGKPYKSSGGEMMWNEKLQIEIPSGWETALVGELLASYPNTRRITTKEYLSDGAFPIFDQVQVKYVAGYTNEKDSVLNQYPAILFGDHSTCVKFINMPFARGADGTQILYSKEDTITPYYFYQAIKALKIPNPGYSRHFKYLKEMRIIKPNGKVVTTYESLAKQMYSLWTDNILAILALTKQRDELLPLLMNGQASVNYDLSAD